MNDKRHENMMMQARQSTEYGEPVRVQITDIDSLAVQYDGDDADITAENRCRAVAYSILAALLRQPSDQQVLNTVSALADVIEQTDDLAIAMSMLGLSARTANTTRLDDEYHALFIGIGRGELVPYASWYLTGFLMEKPLSVLRDDLAAMGFERDEASCEPEDHVAALYEVMVLLIDEGRSLEEQARFFDAHISSWVKRFFVDLGEAKSAVFYRSVARFGIAFFDFEKQYLAMDV